MQEENDRGLVTPNDKAVCGVSCPECGAVLMMGRCPACGACAGGG